MSAVKDQICLLDGSRGIYLPKDFATSYSMVDWGVSEYDEQVLLSGPEHPEYWDTWDTVLNDAFLIKNNEEWRLAQDGDLFAVLMYTEEDT
jgi:hypothetical protein